MNLRDASDKLGAMNAAEHSNWVNASRWLDRFDQQEALPGGGQGEAYRALRKSDQTPAFVKAIKSPKDPERRARFFREATAYDSFDIVGIPQLIESNAHLHKEPSAQLYIATTFIEGPTIRRWRAETTPDLDTGVHMVLALLQILDACHAKGCIHRDVKPDNIILAGGDPAQPKLLDFGLSYHEVPDLEFQTEHGQEVGNRFLRLPELSAGSLDKKDPRSDLSFAAGILFYVLTGGHPDVLQDGYGRLPHQRSQLQAVDVGDAVAFQVNNCFHDVLLRTVVLRTLHVIWTENLGDRGLHSIALLYFLEDNETAFFEN